MKYIQEYDTVKNGYNVQSRYSGLGTVTIRKVLQYYHDKGDILLIYAKPSKPISKNPITISFSDYSGQLTIPRNIDRVEFFQNKEIEEIIVTKAGINYRALIAIKGQVSRYRIQSEILEKLLIMLKSFASENLIRYDRKLKQFLNLVPKISYSQVAETHEEHEIDEIRIIPYNDKAKNVTRIRIEIHYKGDGIAYKNFYRHVVGTKEETVANNYCDVLKLIEYFQDLSENKIHIVDKVKPFLDNKNKNDGPQQGADLKDEELPLSENGVNSSSKDTDITL